MSDDNVVAAAIVVLRRGEHKTCDMELVTPDVDGKFTRDAIQRLIEKLFVTAGAEVR